MIVLHISILCVLILYFVVYISAVIPLKLRNILIYIFYSNYGTDDTTYVNFASLCPSRQNQCRDIISDKDRVVTLLDDGLQVMCDTKTDGGGWIIFQRRINGNVSFYRGWEEYKYGFGDYDAGEFYLGNEYVYKLTSHEQYELRVELSFQGKLYYGMYSTFIVQDENNSYTLVVSGYSGSAPDNLAYHNQIKLTTFDKDNDNNNDNNCAELFSGAWWYKDCHETNLNGFWNNVYGKGATWLGVTGFSHSASSTEMKIRRKLK